MTSSEPYFYTAWVSHTQGSHKIKGTPANMLILRNRGESNIELSLENGDSIDTFLITPNDGFLRLGPSTFSKICYKRVTETGNKTRLDIAVLR